MNLAAPRGSEPVQQSSRRVTNSSLFFLEVLVLNASLVHFDALDGDDTLLGREEPCIRWRVWEEEPGHGARSFSGGEYAGFPDERTRTRSRPQTL